jgi:hypothetical protein
MTHLHHSHDWLALIEKRLAAPEQKQAEAHLAICPLCRAEVLELSGLASDLQSFARTPLPSGTSAWPALWARVQRPNPPARPYPSRQLIACLSVLIVCLIFSNAWVARLAGGAPLTKGVDQPKTQVAVETPQPPGSVAALPEAGTPATQPIQAEFINNSAAPQAVPIATPVPGPTS